jgi:hypothetical protein
MNRELSPLETKILDLFKDDKILYYEDIIKNVEGSESTIYDNLNRLTKNNLITKFNRCENQQGRPRIAYMKRRVKFRIVITEGVNRGVEGFFIYYGFNEEDYSAFVTDINEIEKYIKIHHESFKIVKEALFDANR